MTDAARVPADVLTSARAVIELADELLSVANRTVISDVAAAADLASPGEAAAWRDALGCADPAAVEGKVVLLVVDASRSLWPVTLAAALLRRSGADAVLPLVVHRLH